MKIRLDVVLEFDNATEKEVQENISEIIDEMWEYATSVLERRKSYDKNRHSGKNY